MEINNENGIIDYESDGFIDCLRINKPRVINWPDCQGTIANYFICLPYSEENQTQLYNLQDKIAKIQSIDDFLESGFVKLLKTGKYEFELCNNLNINLLYNYSLHNSNAIVFNDLKKRESNGRFPFGSYLHGFYPQKEQMLFTQPIETINNERVTYYEEQIRSGSRPFAIALQGDEVKYILDGHHKLLAYRNLNIKPVFVLVKKVGNLNNAYQTPSILPLAEKYLLKCQIDHILTYGINSIDTRNIEYTQIVDKYLRNSQHIHEHLIKSLLQRLKSYSKNKKSCNEEQVQWFEKNLKWLELRIEVLKNRFESNRIPILIGRENNIINMRSWKEIEERMN